MAKNGERGVITAVLQLNSMPRFEHILLYQFSSENIFKTFMNWFFPREEKLVSFVLVFDFVLNMQSTDPFSRCGMLIS